MFIQSSRARLERLSEDLAIQVGGPIVLVALLFGAVFVLAYLLMMDISGLLFFPDAIVPGVKEDLAAFYRAGQLAWEGRPLDAYQVEIFQAPFTGKLEKLLFLNPPHFFPVAQIMALGTYAQAKIVLLIMCLAVLVGMPFIFKAPKAIGFFCVFSAAGFYSIVILNISWLIVALIALALVNSERRPVLSGVLLGIATIKPQYGLLAPVILLAWGHYRTIMAAAVTALALCALSVGLYGLEAFQTYAGLFDEGPYRVYADTISSNRFTVLANLGKIGIVGLPAKVIYAILFCALAGMIWWAARNLSKGAVLGLFFLSAGFLSPSIMIYSWAIYLAAHCAFLSDERTGPWPLSLQILMGALWIQPFAIQLITLYFPPIAIGYSLVLSANVAALIIGFAWHQARVQRAGMADRAFASRALNA